MLAGLVALDPAAHEATRAEPGSGLASGHDEPVRERRDAQMGGNSRPLDVYLDMNSRYRGVGLSYRF